MSPHVNGIPVSNPIPLPRTPLSPEAQSGILHQAYQYMEADRDHTPESFSPEALQPETRRAVALSAIRDIAATRRAPEYSEPRGMLVEDDEPGKEPIVYTTPSGDTYIALADQPIPAGNGVTTIRPEQYILALASTTAQAADTDTQTEARNALADYLNYLTNTGRYIPEQNPQQPTPLHTQATTTDSRIRAHVAPNEQQIIAATTYVDTIDAMYDGPKERSEFISETYYQEQLAIVQTALENDALECGDEIGFDRPEEAESAADIEMYEQLDTNTGLTL